MTVALPNVPALEPTVISKDFQSCIVMVENTGNTLLDNTKLPLFSYDTSSGMGGCFNLASLLIWDDCNCNTSQLLQLG